MNIIIYLDEGFMVRVEYSNFLQTLNNNASVEIRKIANLVLENLDELIPLKTAQGQRIKKIASLAQLRWENIGSEISPLPATLGEQKTKIAKIKSLTVGPFRGFSKPEHFDLDSNLVLIYGPNGTGKSSFCEALEYCLLGNVEDAENKRFRNQVEYLKNAHVNRFLAPILQAEDSQNNILSVQPDEQIYRFCFVEKNRIDNFSRIAAQVPSKQTELISTLFGLESFTEFVKNFTPDMDGRYIDIIGEKSKELGEKRSQLLGSEQQIKIHTQLLSDIQSEEINLATRYKENISFDQMVIELNGNEAVPGRVQILETYLQSPLGTKSNLSQSVLNALKQKITELHSALIIEEGKLAQASHQVSFKQLYNAIIELQDGNPNQCPACQTPLGQTTVNPYIYARDELLKLQELAGIQNKIQYLQKQIQDSLAALSQIIQTCLSFYQKENCLEAYRSFTSEKTSSEWWGCLTEMLPDGTTIWMNIEVQVQALEACDLKIKQEEEVRGIKAKELLMCRDFVKEITILQTRRQSATQAISIAQSMISTFEEQNAQLITDVETEKLIVSRNKIISNVYADFVKKLEAYCNELPLRLVKDLGGVIIDLYNAFNRNDTDSELLAEVRLPINQNQRMEIAFKSNPEVFFDALHILSEGHIRCLGLAILLAKNLKEESPLLIFDDPVNAIDDEHREAIRKTLFEDKFFTDKQILLTCHGEEFFKDIHNLLSVERVKLTKSFSFLPRLGEPHININFNCAPRNYIVAAREHINQNEIRDALTKSRQALEAITKGKVWKYVSKHGDGNLSLKLRSATSSIELRNLTEQLKTRIGKNDFVHAQKESVFKPLEALLGISGECREWRYLNKGVHEEQDRVEFDRSVVSSIVLNLENLDQALN